MKEQLMYEISSWAPGANLGKPRADSAAKSERPADKLTREILEFDDEGGVTESMIVICRGDEIVWSQRSAEAATTYAAN
jgi:hypothetical protein